MRRTLSDTTPIDPASLTSCSCGIGYPHLRCDHATTVSAKIAEWKEREAFLDSEIATYPCWGAALTAMDEERSGLRRAIAHAEASL